MFWSSFALGSVVTAVAARVYARHIKRIRNADWVTPNMLGKRRIRGIVTSVADGDGFRLYHTPAIGWRFPLNFRNLPQRVKGGETLYIRLAGVDAPEMSSFGKPEQPFAKEAQLWLSDKILGKHVVCELLSKDQYRRVIANAYVSSNSFLPLFKTNLAHRLLSDGYGTVYEQHGAQYGSWGKELYQKLEADAKEDRRGMWKNGPDIETPAQYKRRHAQGNVDDASASSDEDTAVPESKTWIRRLLSKT
ncbi:staphylococcal nuclease [Pluteus cervinus]|uniref:Staphylococcal nuclease n=1 Tax=Pluteus cervinus TaxID=181527 RepID=A0ACD3ATX2_9AGAR|nr:staphylococcal nuclease [Pluteus cervinus]